MHEERARAAEAQLVRYASDLKLSLAGERRHARDLEKSHRDSLLRLLRAARFKDNESASHLRRLSRLAKVIAQHLGWQAAEIEMLAAATPLHDVGKIGVPDAILHKPGPLNEAEWKVMKRHPSFGALLLKGTGSPTLCLAHEIALCHHERWDGSGYPRGLAGADIPLSARIVSLCDVYDALRMVRPYKTALPHSRVCEIILLGDNRTSPRHFDPRVLEAFRQLQDEFELTHARVQH
jgi:putative two-component system response regulator